MAREIINPRWANLEKTHIVCGFRYDDGRVLTASITNEEGQPPNPDWTEIIETFGYDLIDKNSQDALLDHMQRKQSKQERIAIEIERQQKETLFNAKAEVFDMDVIRNSTNREIKNKIRRASSITEVLIYSAVLHMLEDPIVLNSTGSGSANT